MLDPEIFDKLNPENKSIVVPMVRPLNKDKLTDEQIMTVNTVLYGFSLGDKIWGEKDPISQQIRLPNTCCRRFRCVATVRRGLERRDFQIPRTGRRPERLSA